MSALRETMAGIFGCVFLAGGLPAQQHAGYPFCGVASLDTLKETQAFVGVTAWREEPINQELHGTRALLLDSLQDALRAAAHKAAATGGPKRGRSMGQLQLLIGIGRPQNGLAPVGGSWLLLLPRLLDSSGYQPPILGWHFRGPLHQIAADSALEGAKREGLRLITDLLDRHLETCRRIRNKPLGVPEAWNRPPTPSMEPMGRNGAEPRGGSTLR
jgi:hypothetical protein